MYYNTFLIILSLLLPSVVFTADNIQRSEDSEGIVEFSNVSTKKKNSGKQTVIYKYPQAGEEITVFTDQKPTHISDYEVLKFDCFACNPHSKIDWHKVTLNLISYADIVKQAAENHNIDPALVRAIIHAESGFNSKAVSNKGATGLMQLMPGTAKQLGVINALNAKDNINGGVKYLAQLLQEFNGNIKLASAAYNAGPNAVKRYNGIPPYKETQVYVERVNILYQRYQRAG
ncbi:MAG: lytic transglycosylase [Methylophaga sp.]|nr:MAG: lytic transglycosylase [Methylophaga sp.]